jgi:hypothetical protein
MALVKDQILFLLSGGTSNIDPSQSLGGEPSTAIILDGINNLFSNVTREHVTSGYIDYRCFYIYNNSEDPLTDLEIFIASQVEGGSVGYLGINIADDEQQVSVLSTNLVTGGYFTFTFGDSPSIHVNYDADIDNWATNFQNALLTYADLTSVTVTGSFFPDYSVGYFHNQKAYIFVVQFSEIDGQRNQPYITINGNHLTGVSNIDMSVLKKVTGSPCNTIARSIAAATTVPDGVIFYNSSPINRITLGSLMPREYLPIWIKRVTPSGVSEMNNDGFSVNLVGNAEIF